MSTAPLDTHVARVLDTRRADASSDEDEDALIAALEDEDPSSGTHSDPTLAALREQRLDQLHAELTRAQLMRETGAGTYIELHDEKAILDLTTTHPRTIVHFMKPDFGRCAIMDERLGALAPKHFDTRFIKIHVDNAPFLVTKLQIQVLPCVIAFIDGVGKDRIIGFEGLGRGDNFTTQDLEYRLLSAGVLTRAKMTDDEASRRPQQMEQHQRDDEYDDDDWD